MNSPVQKIKECLKIEDVISSYIKLEKTGANYKAKCPFHNEKTPSFFVSPSRESYYCFGCGAKGDIFTFVEQFEGLDFKGALTLLAKRAGVSLSMWKREDNVESSLLDRLYKVMEEAERYFFEELKNQKEAKDYLKKRGITNKTIEDFRIGFAKNDWHCLYNHLKEKFSDEEIEKAGLIKKSEKSSEGGNIYYDRFRSRIMFPIRDSSGRVVAFSGRIFPHNDKEGKYINSPATPIFKKSSVLYGIDKAKDSIRKNDFSIVVEGQFDLLMSHQAGFRNTVATLGTALTDKDTEENDKANNFGIIKRISQNIVFVFDSDKAGFMASQRAAITALSYDMNVKGADIGEGLDPADLILQKGVDAWRSVIRNAKHIIEFLLEKYTSDFSSNDSLKTKMEIENKIIPFLMFIENPVKKSHFISIISHKTGIREEDIRELLKKRGREKEEEERSEIKPKEENFLRKDYILRRLMGIILWQKSAKKPIIKAEDILAKITEITNFSTEELLAKAEENNLDLIFEAEVFYEKKEDISTDIKEMIDNLEEEFLKNSLSEKMKELYIVETQKDKLKVDRILNEISEINKKIQKIKNSRNKI
ncbi:MAG: DNA primase [Candidatus Paceibacterota bacterium]|jgi:DNA primase